MNELFLHDIPCEAEEYSASVYERILMLSADAGISSLQRQRLHGNRRRNVVGPHLLCDTLNAQLCRDIPEAVLPGLLGDVPLALVTA
jgi:hypothetical protein